MYSHTLTGMASPYTPGEISNSTRYTMPNGQQVTALNDGPSYEDLLRRMEFASGRKMGTGNSGGGGGRPMSTGRGGDLMGAYGKAYGDARGANESRYNDILAEFDRMLGGGGYGQPTQQKGFHVQGGRSGQSRFQQWRDSGSPQGYFEWMNTRRGLEHTAADRGGAYGSIDARDVYPREWGGGRFLGDPRQAQGGGQQGPGPRPTVAPPTYPTYNMPQRPPMNY